ncbi:MAG TPA: hypothetical protein VFM31_00655 [Nitrososphaeraceae archaeon]|nr:hypothetical protein [Nitrososphaeraceae archaeon]
MKTSTSIAFSSLYMQIITMIGSLLLASIFFGIDKVWGERENSTVVNNNNNKTMNSTQQQVLQAECKSPCPSDAEMCIEMCA